MRGKKLHFSLVTFQLALDLSSRCDKQNHIIIKVGKELQDHQIQPLIITMPINPYLFFQDTFLHSGKLLGDKRPWRSLQQVRDIYLHIRDQWGVPSRKTRESQNGLGLDGTSVPTSGVAQEEGQRKRGVRKQTRLSAQSWPCHDVQKPAQPSLSSL